ncbi:MAG: Coq4 family protein, partial [Polyangiales bacterium]
ASEMHPIDYDDADLQWATDWLRDTHDLWHTVLGYQGDLVGEAALLAFSHEHIRNRGLAVIASLAWWKLGRVTDKSVEARKTIVHGRRLAKETVWFVDVPWHEWLARPLAEVRRDLGVTSPVKYEAVRTEDVDTRLVA